MSGKRMKALRRMAEDLTPTHFPERDIVAHVTSDTTAFNSPQSVRGAYQALKKSFNKRRRGA